MSTAPDAAAVELPPASVVVPSRGRPELLHATVESILGGAEVPAELIIVDQSDAPDPWFERFATHRPCAVRYLWTGGAGLSRARNAGVAAARHGIVAFTDDDVSVTPTWFGVLVRALVRAGPRSVVTGRVLPGPAQSPGGFAPSIKVDEQAAVYAGRIGRDVLYPNNMALFRAALDEVGEFDDRLGAGAPFPSAEDNDFCFRLLEAGYQIHYVPEAVLYHLAWRTERDYLPLVWSYAFGQGAYYAKHLHVGDLYMLGRMLRHAGSHVLQFGRRLRRERRRAYGDALYVFGLLVGAGKWLLTQRGARPRRGTAARRAA